MTDRQRARRAGFDALFRLWCVNLAAGTLLAYRYLLAASGLDSAVAAVYAHFLLIPAVGGAYLALLIALVLPVWLVPRRAVIIGFAAPALYVAWVLLLVDTSIFRFYRFHINGMVINLLMTEGSSDSVILGGATLGSAALVLAFALAAEVMAVRWAVSRMDAAGEPARGRFGTNRRAVAAVVGGLAAAVLADKVIYAVADLRGVTAITRQARLYPLYQGITIRRFSERWLKLRIDRDQPGSLAASGGALDYPKQPLVAAPPAPLPNILWVVVDGFRSDMLTPEVTPHIERFARGALTFTNHYSGGNATRFGIFSLFYGLDGFYWRPFLEERRGPVLIDELVRLGYEMKILSATRLTFPEFRETVFVRVPAALEDRLPGERWHERDAAAADRFDEWLGTRGPSRPFFAAVLLSAPHGPYSYPASFRRFLPAVEDPDYVATTSADAGALRNAYRNALLFDDAVTGRILAALERRHLAEDTVVLVTADHGEEFLERGFFGHGGAFGPEATRVAFVLRIPGVAPQTVTRLTGHADVVPTFLSLLGYSTPAPAFSQGMSLLDPAGHDFVVCAGWDQGALVDREGFLVFSTETYNAPFFEARDAEYRPIPDEKAVLRRKRAEIERTARGMREFLR